LWHGAEIMTCKCAGRGDEASDECAATLVLRTCPGRKFLGTVAVAVVAGDGGEATNGVV